MLLDGFSSMPCEEASPPALLWTRGPLGSCLGCGLVGGQGTHLGLESDAATWVWVKAQVQWGQRGKEHLGWTLVEREMLLGEW